MIDILAYTYMLNMISWAAWTTTKDLNICQHTEKERCNTQTHRITCWACALFEKWIWGKSWICVNVIVCFTCVFHDINCCFGCFSEIQFKHISLSLSLSLSIDIYVHIYIYMNKSYRCCYRCILLYIIYDVIYTYIYIYII